MLLSVSAFALTGRLIADVRVTQGAASHCPELWALRGCPFRALQVCWTIVHAYIYLTSPYASTDVSVWVQNFIAMKQTFHRDGAIISSR